MLKTVKKETMRLCKDCRMGLCSFSFIFIIFFAGLISIGSLILSHTHGVMRLITLYLIMFFCNAASAPLLVGAYEWIHQLYIGKIRPMKNSFSPFSDISEVLRTERIFLTYSSALRLSFIPAAVPFLVVSYSSTIHPYDILFIVLGGIVSLKLLCGVFLLMHILICAPHISLLKALHLSFISMSTRFGDFCRLIIKYAVLTALSALTFGVLFIFTLPYIFCSTVVFCDTVYEENELYKYNFFY